MQDHAETDEDKRVQVCGIKLYNRKILCQNVVREGQHPEYQKLQKDDGIQRI